MEAQPEAGAGGSEPLGASMLRRNITHSTSWGDAGRNDVQSQFLVRKWEKTTPIQVIFVADSAI